MFSVTTTIPVIVYLERKMRDNIRHAKLICPGHEDTRECRVAWDQVEDIQRAIHKKKEKEKAEGLDKSLLERDQYRKFYELPIREYDV